MCVCVWWWRRTGTTNTTTASAAYSSPSSRSPQIISKMQRRCLQLPPTQSQSQLLLLLRCGGAGAPWPVNYSSRVRHQPSCRSSGEAAAAAVTEEDRQYMRQALQLAQRGVGHTHPNPAVGCVIVRDGKVVGEGFHPKAGMPHAEVYALRGAGRQAEGATAYVTLEPCNHFGRTPPCSQALVDAKVARVVVGVGDPNPLVAAAGIATLQAAGIEVALVGGQEEQQCYSINEEFMARMKEQAAAAGAGGAGGAS